MFFPSLFFPSPCSVAFAFGFALGCGRSIFVISCLYHISFVFVLFSTLWRVGRVVFGRDEGEVGCPARMLLTRSSPLPPLVWSRGQSTFLFCFAGASGKISPAGNLCTYNTYQVLYSCKCANGSDNQECRISRRRADKKSSQQQSWAWPYRQSDR